MEIELSEGRIARNGLGMPKTLHGGAALLQRACTRIAAARGAFPYLRTLGSRIPGMNTAEGHAAEQALGFAREALLDLPGVEAVHARVDGKTVTVQVETTNDGESIAVEIGGKA